MHSERLSDNGREEIRRVPKGSAETRPEEGFEMEPTSATIESMEKFDERLVERLARLGRLALTDEEKKRLAKDLSKILAHFEELQELDTKEVAPMTGGTNLSGVFRGDEAASGTNARKGTTAFPETRDGFLVVPPIFDRDAE